ncbi:MAG: endonuclease [Bacilli bacterium]|nr:endonuclease [Bacilli bacterium]
MKFGILFLLLNSLIATNVGLTPSFKQPINKAVNPAGTIYADLSEANIKSYYGDISVGDKGETLLSKLDTILKRNIKKCSYDSGTSKNSKAWNGYYLTERNWDLSPLEESELSGNYKTSGIWINQLYCKSPLYIESSINSGNYKYKDNNGNEVTNTFASSNRQIDREHVFAKSYGFNDSGDYYKKLTTGCDPQNLRAGEHQGNSAAHNNLPYGVVVNKSASTTTAYTSKMTGESVGYTGLDKNGIKVYEPPEQDKGDIARICFYMAACYHKYNENDGVDIYPALTLSNNSDTSKAKNVRETATYPAEYGQLDALLEWHAADPVSSFEIHRNNLVYNSVGYNRNPFIDYPEWAFACFTPSESDGADFKNLNRFATDDKDLKINIPTSYKDGNDIKFKAGKNIIPEINATYLETPVEFKLINEATNTEISDTSTLSNGIYNVHFEVTYDAEVHKSSSMKMLVTRESGNIHDVRVELDEAKFKAKYTQFEKFTPEGIKVYLDDTETNNYILFNKAGEKLTEEYTLLGIEKMKIYAQVEADGLTYKSEEFEITIELSIVQILIIAGVIIVVLIILIAIIASSKSRKKRRKQAKTFENVVKKVGKSVNNYNKKRR